MKRFLWCIGVFSMLGAGCASTSTLSAPDATSQAVASAEFVQSEPTSALKASVTTPMIVAPVVPVAAPEPLTVSMASGNFFFDPSTITARPGQEVSVVFSDSEGDHTFVIDELALKERIATGTVITFVAPETPGNYAYYCDVGAHRKLGMEGVLIVK